jgi:hypothetical protein
VLAQPCAAIWWRTTELTHQRFDTALYVGKKLIKIRKVMSYILYSEIFNLMDHEIGGGGGQ